MQGIWMLLYFLLGGLATDTSHDPAGVPAVQGSQLHATRSESAQELDLSSKGGMCLAAFFPGLATRGQTDWRSQQDPSPSRVALLVKKSFQPPNGNALFLFMAAKCGSLARFVRPHGNRVSVRKGVPTPVPPNVEN